MNKNCAYCGEPPGELLHDTCFKCGKCACKRHGEYRFEEDNAWVQTFYCYACRPDLKPKEDKR